MYTESIQEVQR